MVENMAYFRCGGCGEEHHIFGREGTAGVSKEMDVEIIGRVRGHRPQFLLFPSTSSPVSPLPVALRPPLIMGSCAESAHPWDSSKCLETGRDVVGQFRRQLLQRRLLLFLAARFLSVSLPRQVPLEESTRQHADEGTPVVVSSPHIESSRAFREISRVVLSALGLPSGAPAHTGQRSQ